ncbi:hypothetical protein OIU85_025920 [Salix viminalis]|uniref:Amino acid transporter transmembrane domain-containing protein n=1 Tax=Salix viminalis TaxID=40686 RepID=A0A9Q0TML3_SALVM|nr:hypothetical protein OIU85_025920 [Salix viminalis]
MVPPPKSDPFAADSHREVDAGAVFVLESKGEWWHAGFHLTTAIVGAYNTDVLDYCERDGRRHIRFRELAADVLGSGWMFYFVILIQTAINTGVGIGAILLAGECLQIMYSSLSPDGSLKLFQRSTPSDISIWLHYFSVWATVSLLSVPAFMQACQKMPLRGTIPWNLQSQQGIFNAFTSISIIAAIFGNGILPEIQATLAPPATGKMVKGLLMCYALFAIGLVYSQVAYEIMEKKSADVQQGMFSKRNLLPRIILRTLYMIFCGFMAAMLPFFGDINGVVGAIGFIPLDFVLPMLLYNMTYKPPKSSLTYWLNLSIMVVFTGAGTHGCILLDKEIGP